MNRVAVFQRNASGTPSSPRIIVRPSAPVSDWSPDGYHIVILRNGEVVAFPVPPEDVDSPAIGGPMRVTKTRSEERDARVSPDGRWLAYASNESG